MKVYKTESVTRENKRLVSHTCDRCGASLVEGLYDISEVEIRSKHGDSYPEGSHYTASEIDCCVKCFDSAVLPALVSLGFAVRVSEAEF